MSFAVRMLRLCSVGRLACRVLITANAAAVFQAGARGAFGPDDGAATPAPAILALCSIWLHLSSGHVNVRAYVVHDAGENVSGR